MTLVARRNTNKDQDASASDEISIIKVRAHHLVLRAASPYIEAMFAQMESNGSPGKRKARWAESDTREVTIREVDPSSFDSIIKFIYGDESAVNKVKWGNVTCNSLS